VRFSARTFSVGLPVVLGMPFVMRSMATIAVRVLVMTGGHVGRSSLMKIFLK
jgi:hypothetical protein